MMPDTINNLELRENVNPVKDIWRRNTTALIALAFIILLAISSGFSGIILKYQPNAQGDLLTDRYQPPTYEHLFGTDKFGRDIFSRVIYGGKISLSIALSVVLLSMTIGLLYGAASGYSGGMVDGLMMRFLDFLLAFPAIFLIIAIVAIFNPNHWFLIPLLAFTGWMEIARIARAEVMSLRERDFILAVRGMGFHRWRIIFRHVIPNCLTPVMVAAPFKVAEVILLESALSFLGIGVQPPTPSWGNIINDGREALTHAWWISTFPGIFIAITVLCFNVIGDAVRQKLSRES